MDSSIILLRIVYSLGLLGTAVFLPWYLVLTTSLIGMFLFKNYFEGVIVLILLDGLYGFTGSIPYAGMYTVIGVVSLVVIQRLKKHLAWYS